MNKEWKTAFMEAMKERIGKITEENILTMFSETGGGTLKSLFRIYPDEEGGVLAIAASKDIPADKEGVEIRFVMDTDVLPEHYRELEHAIVEINYFLPIGAAGIEYETDKIAVRYVYVLDTKKTTEELVEDTFSIYELLMASVRLVYPGLSKIGTGIMTFDEAVKNELLIRQVD